MKATADKSPVPQRQAAAYEAPPQQNLADNEFQFVDNRAETASLRQLQEVTDNSPQVQGLSQLKAMMNNSPRSGAIQSLQAMVDNSSCRASRVLLAESGNELVQRVEDEELLQGEFFANSPVQLAQLPDAKPNNTGLPDNLKAGVESLSGLSLDNVKVHYNSAEPAQLNAQAYAQGTDIHLGPGQEQHLPHETWHVVQQAQGRVKPTMQMKDGVKVNDDQGLESEADLMGERAVSVGVIQEKHELNDSIEFGSYDLQMRNDHKATIKCATIDAGQKIQSVTQAPVQGVFEISNIDYNPQTGAYSTGALNAAGTRNAVSVAINASGVFQPGHKNIRAGVLNTAISNAVLGGLQQPDIDAMIVAVETLIIAEYLARGRPLAGLALTTELTRIVTDALVANLGADIMDAGERGDFDILMARVTQNGGVPSRAKGAPTQLAFGNLPDNVAGDVTTILNDIRAERALWQPSTLLLNAPLLNTFAGGINTRQGNKHYQGNHTNNAGWLPGVAVPIDQVTPLHLVVAASRGVGTILNAGDPAGQFAQERAARSTAWRQYIGAFSGTVYESGLDATAIKLSAMAVMCQGISAYIEFWMATTNISRLVYDPVNGRVCITAHYRWRNGYNPFVEVTGFPAV